MTPDHTITTCHADAPAPDERAIRSKGVKRSWICPGTGFAIIGSAPPAIATFAASLCTLPALAWLAFRPTAASMWTTVTVLAIAAILWIAEQIAVKRSALRPPAPRMLVGRFAASSCVMWFAMILAGSLLVTSFGSLRVAASGMSPTLKKGERLVYHKHVDRGRVTPGAIIVYRNAGESAWGRPGWLVITRILAGPGDKLSIKDANYLVNGNTGPQVAATGRHDVVINVPYSPETLMVPQECFFIVQDSPTRGFDGRVLSWVRANSIVGSRLWYVSSRGILRPVE